MLADLSPMNSETITTLLASYPHVFKASPPAYSGNLPSGWQPLIIELCDYLQKVCTKEQLRALRVLEIKYDDDSLNFEIDFGNALNDSQALTFGAKLFALRNRSRFSCHVCGQLVQKFPAQGEPPVCDSHL